MEDLQMYNFSVKSRIHNYEVQFVSNTKETLIEELKNGDTIIIDNIVREKYYEIFGDILNMHSFIGIDATEEQKSYQGIITILDHLIQNGFKKNQRLIAIGGGITQDVTAFISSILYRGVGWFFFPTTLLAQADSCIGSKTSINFGMFKNQIGGFYPPRKIYIDLSFLNTLDDVQIKSGMGEMCHYFIISGKKDFYKFRENFSDALQNKYLLSEMIARSLEIKKRYIEIDEFDRKERQIFNYGHSFGHAIESLTNFSVPHGIAVSYGMDMANFISVKLGYISENTRAEIREVLKQIWTNFPINDIDLEKFVSSLRKDKKNVDNELRIILNTGYGKIIKQTMLFDDLFYSWLKEYFSNELV